MTEQTEQKPAKKKLSLSRPGRLELKKTVDAGQVRQSFSHGRTKAVAVEVRRKRTFAQSADGDMTEVKPALAEQEPVTAEVAPEAVVADAAVAPAEDGQRSQPRELTEQERAARARALVGLKQAETEERVAEEARKALERAAEEERRHREEEAERERAEAEARAQEEEGGEGGSGGGRGTGRAGRRRRRQARSATILARALRRTATPRRKRATAKGRAGGGRPGRSLGASRPSAASPGGVPAA